MQQALVGPARQRLHGLADGGQFLLESALAFLRLSDPNVASWGNLIGLGRDVLRVQWYVSAIPGIAILVTVLAVSLVGQGLNDALNPRLKSR